jgi:rod shape determining protein RodA
LTITENRHARAHVDGVLIFLVFAMSLFGIVAVCVATYSPQSSENASFLNHIFESTYATRQCLFLLVAPLVIGVIMAALMGGGGVALLASGPAGLIMGFVIGVLAAVIGTKAAEQMIYKSEVPAWIRKLFMPMVLKKMFSAQRGTLLKSINSQLMREVDPPSEAVMNTVNTIAHAIEDELEKMMRRAALLIR